MRSLICFLAVVVFALWSCTKPNVELQQFAISGPTQGTTYNIKIVEPKDAPFDQPRFQAQIDSLLRHIDQLMSTYQQDSELSLFNRAPKNEWMPVSKSLVDVFSAAAAMSEKSDGAFDITVGPLVNLWGFGPENNVAELPPEVEILRRQAMVGYQHIKIQVDPPALQKDIDSLYCDLSAIAQGWSVDQVADFIESDDHHNYLVEIGGEIRAKGMNLKKGPWRIGVAAPDQLTGIQKVIAVKDVAVSTSGDYRNYFEKHGVRYSHTIDPKTGRPIAHKLVSVTVIHPSCMLADAYATAIDVLGPEAGMALAEKENLPVFLLVKSDNGFEEKMTPLFEQYVTK